jgi:hypothetical protein
MNSDKLKFASVFGEEKFDDSTAGQMELINRLEGDVLLCVFSNGKFLRTCFLTAGSKQGLKRLPQGPFTIRMILGGKNQNRTFYFSKSSLNLKDSLLLTKSLIHEMFEVGETEFFTLNKTE